MSRPEGLNQTLDDDTEAHLFDRGQEAANTSAQGVETDGRLTPSLVSLRWAVQWAAAEHEPDNVVQD